ncbi:MAG: prolyl oligopeptidase family serine peptidase [Thermoproteota archaeon]
MAQIDQDPYIWLENLEDPAVVNWVLEKNKKARELLSMCSRTLVKKLEKYYDIPTVVKVVVGKGWYYALIRESHSFRVIRFNESRSEEIISSSELGHDVVIKDLSADHEDDLLAFSYSIGGSDIGYLVLMKPSIKDVVDRLYGVIGDLVWLGRNRYYYVKIYYNQRTPDGVEPPATRVFLCEGGKEEMVFGKGLPSLYFVGLKKSMDSSKALVTVSYGWSRTDVYAGDLELPETWKLLYGGEDFISYPVDYVRGKYILVAFDDPEGTGRIISISEGFAPEEIVRPIKYPIKEATLVNNFLLVHYLVDASSVLRIYDIRGNALRELNFVPKGYISSMDSNGSICVLKYESFTVPYRLYVFDGNVLKLLRSSELDGKYFVEELWVLSKDLTPVHVFRVRNREIDVRAVLAYGYGGFGIPLTPRFAPYILPLLEDGFEYIVANLRGGGEYGEKWHRAGMRDKKQKVFDDFIVVLERLKSEGKRVFVYGVSNGGLLVGAVLTQRPELLDGAIIGYPVLDMLRFDKLFIGKLWTTEFGNPDKNEDRKFLLEYSPYHNLKPGVKYPPVMLVTGLKDDRVHPAHSFKFAAKLEELKASYLLRVETESGHSGASPPRKIAEYADILAFIYRCLERC